MIKNTRGHLASDPVHLDGLLSCSRARCVGQGRRDDLHTSEVTPQT
jgi:hypothetical protein